MGPLLLLLLLLLLHPPFRIFVSSDFNERNTSWATREQRKREEYGFAIIGGHRLRQLRRVSRTINLSTRIIKNRLGGGGEGGGGGGVKRRECSLGSTYLYEVKIPRNRGNL